MRRLAVCAAMLWFSGCGSQSTKPPEGAATQNGSQAHPQSPAVAPTKAPSDPVVSAELSESRTLIAKAHYGAANERLSTLIGSHPESADAFAQRAQVKAELHQDADAMADYSTAVRLAPSDSSVYTQRGLFLLSRANTGGALADFDAAIERNPRDPKPHNHRGAALLTRGELAKAIESIDRAIALDPKYADAYGNRAFAYLKADRRKEALADLDQAIALEPTSADRFNNRGLLRFRTGDVQSAIADFTEAIKLKDNNPKFYAHRREAFLKLGRYPEAQADMSRIEWLVRLASLNEAVLRDKRSPKPYIERGTFFLDDGHLDDAIANFNRALELDPRQWRALAERARARVRRGEFQQAVDDCTAALAIEARDAVYAVRGDAYRSLGQFEKAVADYDASRRFDAEVGKTWLQYAQALRQGGRVKEADAALERANELNALNAPSAN